MNAQEWQTSYIIPAGGMSVEIDFGAHGTYSFSWLHGHEEESIDEWCAALSAEFVGRMVWVLQDDGKIEMQEANGYTWGWTCTDPLFAAYLGLPASLAGQAGPYEGTVCPGWWAGYVKRDWGYSRTRKAALLGGGQGGIRTTGIGQSDRIIFWSSIDAVTEAAQLYRMLYYAADNRILKDDSGRRFVLGDQAILQAEFDRWPRSAMEVELLAVEVTG